MKQKNLILLLILLLLSIGILPSCNKYLDASPDKKLIIPNSIADLQALLDNAFKMNRSMISVGEFSADNYYVTDDDYNAMTLSCQNIYTWGNEIVYDDWPNMWSTAYDVVYNANVALDNINHFSSNGANAMSWNNVKGSALFFRSFAFANIAFNWAEAYSEASAHSKPGIPLRLTSDFNQPTTRFTLYATYHQIIDDLTSATKLLPSVPIHVMRPSKGAAYALLARVYLAMSNYDSALDNALTALSIQDTLMDYNRINTAANYPFTLYNPEIIFYSQMNLPGIYPEMDTTLLSMYDEQDLRKKAFFKPNTGLYAGTFSFKGGYSGSGPIFDGLATDELFLIVAECYCRKNMDDKAREEINILLQHRYSAGTSAPTYPKQHDQLLNYILSERRKELVYRDLRWIDIKRLNEQGETMGIKRIVNGKTFTLPPRSGRFALPLPAYIVDMDGLEQNPL